MKKLGHSSKAILALSILTFLSNLPASGGEDVANARNNALSDYPIDFWGGISSLIFSNIPDFPLGWPVHLLLFQVLVITVCLIAFAEKFISRTKKFKYFFLIFSYLAFIFGSHQTRDGLMFSLILLGFTILHFSSRIPIGMFRVCAIILSAFLLLIAFSLRPWVSFSCSLLLAALYFKRNMTKKVTRKYVFSIIILILFPLTTIAIELTAQNLAGLHTIHPEQQVISMDLGAAYCWSTNPKTVKTARDALSLMYLDQNPGNVCESFKPINWVWFSRNPILMNSDSPTTFTFLTEKNEEKYQKLQSKWIGLVRSDPASYIQNKYMFASQVFIAGDSRYVRILNEAFYSNSTRANLLDTFVGIFFLPWDIVISLHLLSMQFTLVFWIVLVLRQYYKRVDRSISGDIIISMSFLLWLVATVVAYIGDNGRYTYTASLALLFTLFLYGGSNSHKEKNDKP